MVSFFAFSLKHLILNCVIFQIDVEKLAGFLPLHLISVLVSSDRDEALLRYLLCGIRLLHSLCELAPRHTKLEQVALSNTYLVIFCSDDFSSLFIHYLLCLFLHMTRT